MLPKPQLTPLATNSVGIEEEHVKSKEVELQVRQTIDNTQQALQDVLCDDEFELFLCLETRLVLVHFDIRIFNWH